MDCSGIACMHYETPPMVAWMPVTGERPPRAFARSGFVNLKVILEPLYSICHRSKR
jgi:hypothetical protein